MESAAPWDTYFFDIIVELKLMINKEGRFIMLIEDALKEITNYPKETSERYYNEDGICVPRVTEILSSMMHSDALLYWANNLGFRKIKYKTALTQAANIGTNAHNAIERFLVGKATQEDYDNISFQAFLAWHNIFIKEGIDFEVLGMEEKLTCKWFGGTYDLLVKINGRIFLVDLKTSNHITEKYFMQLAAYIYMLALKGIFVDGTIILQLSKESDTFNEYTIDLSIPGHFTFMENCTRAFLSLVYAYYNVAQVRSQFKTLF